MPAVVAAVLFALARWPLWPRIKDPVQRAGECWPASMYVRRHHRTASFPDRVFSLVGKIPKRKDSCGRLSPCGHFCDKVPT